MLVFIIQLALELGAVVRHRTTTPLLKVEKTKP